MTTLKEDRDFLDSYVPVNHAERKLVKNLESLYQEELRIKQQLIKAQTLKSNIATEIERAKNALYQSRSTKKI